MRIIDARKKLCPEPVIMAKKAADEGVEQITVIVDNETAKSNVMKLGAKLNYGTVYEYKNDGIYILLKKDTDIVNEETMAEVMPEEQLNTNMVYLISTDKLGKGSEELGRILMKSFLYSISEKTPYPTAMIFLNSGVKLTTEGSECIDDLMKLKEGNVKIVSCGTCLDFFEIKSKLRVGSVSNMYDIVDIISSSANTVTI